ncbi:TPA: acetyltransferase, partial [Staphylococcus aureus]|nr:acetyltransferase [Staphylococcus aureus]
MTVTLSDEQYKNLCTKLNKLLGKFHKALKERDEYKKQQDELIVDIGKLRERNKELENMWRTLKNELLGRYEHYCF